LQAVPGEDMFFLSKPWHPSVHPKKLVEVENDVDTPCIPHAIIYEFLIHPIFI
jgi:hypothetical protein